jgi:aryl-phospho-beta-D-glucosidase BglC (GH1 family)
MLNKNLRRNKKTLWFRLIVSFVILIFTVCSLQELKLNSNGKLPGITSTTVTASTINDIGRLTGINWFGFETRAYVAHGLWARDYGSILQQIKDLGFNSIRIPWCNEMLTKSPGASKIVISATKIDPYTKIKGWNQDLAGLNSLQVLDKIIDKATRVYGLKIILDNHSLLADNYANEEVWYSSTYPESVWISDWVSMVNRYKSNPYVCMVDLKNEPHGGGARGEEIATWGYQEPGVSYDTNWRAAAIRCAKAILAANPNLIIAVEGVAVYKGDWYWNGGNLKGVADYPIAAADIPSSQLMYSPHEYGPEVYNQPWFSDPIFPANMPGVWDTHFNFIVKNNIAPALYFGEFGIKEASAAAPTSKSYIWFTNFLQYVGMTNHWAFWCFNCNSGDTGGIVKSDWYTLESSKYNLIKPYMAPQFPPLQ